MRSVAHSFAQHALSGLSRDTPERTIEQRRSNIESISVILTGDVTINAAMTQEASLLVATFIELLSKESIDLSSVISAQANFTFVGQCRTPAKCQVMINTAEGQVVECVVDESHR